MVSPRVPRPFVVSAIQFSNDAPRSPDGSTALVQCENRDFEIFEL